jgi:hypothetical protein
VRGNMVEDFEQAKSINELLRYQSSDQKWLPAQTRKFKHVANLQFSGCRDLNDGYTASKRTKTTSLL